MFTNTGKEPLIIEKAKGSCGCTVPEWPKEPIAPGETAVIKINYDEKRVGPYTKSITITSNAKTSIKNFIPSVSSLNKVSLFIRENIGRFYYKLFL